MGFNEHGDSVGEEGDGGQQKQDRDEADVWCCSCEGEISCCLVLSKVLSVHSNTDWSTLLVDRVGTLIEWWRRALNECFVNEHCVGFSESAELASHARHAWSTTNALGTLFHIGLESHWLEEFTALSCFDVDFTNTTNFELSWMGRFELWLVIETEDVGGLGPWIELVI